MIDLRTEISKWSLNSLEEVGSRAGKVDKGDKVDKEDRVDKEDKVDKVDKGDRADLEDKGVLVLTKMTTIICLTDLVANLS